MLDSSVNFPGNFLCILSQYFVVKMEELIITCSLQCQGRIFDPLSFLIPLSHHDIHREAETKEASP